MKGIARKMLAGLVALFLGNFFVSAINCVNDGKESGIILNQQEWPRIYDGGDDDAIADIAIDSDNNIIGAGYTFHNSTYDFYTVKYDSHGNEIWNATYDGGAHEFAMDVAVDSEDNIIVFGFTGDVETFEGDFLIIKYSSDGIKLWNKTYDKDVCDYPGGVAIDSQDDIIVTGGAGDFRIEMSYWTIKMDGNGNEIWNKTYHAGYIDASLCVAVDSQDNIIVAGVSALPFTTDCYYFIKYDSNGNEIWEGRYAGVEPYDIAIDSAENIIVVGHGYSQDTRSATWRVVKCDKDGKLLWEQEYDSGEDDAAEGVAINSEGNIVVGGFSCFSKEKNYEHCLIIYDSEGKEICLRRPSIEGIILGIAVDSTDAIFVAGNIIRLTSDAYITKYSEITPPSAYMKKPKEKKLYIFDKELMQFPLNMIIGKITIEVEGDMTKVEFYVDNKLMATVDTQPYSYTWDETVVGKHRIKIMAYDDEGDAIIDEREIWIINIGKEASKKSGETDNELFPFHFTFDKSICFLSTNNFTN